MRIILIILSLSTFGFLAWIVYSMKGNMNLPVSSPSVNVSNTDASLMIETIKQQHRIEEKLNAIEQKLAAQNPVIAVPTGTQTGSTTENTIQTEPVVVPVSVKFLGKILPTIELIKADNAGIFDLRIFDNITYTTYKDEKFGITVVASMLPYENFLKNFQSLDKNVYTVNVTQTFPFDTFYVNPPKSDTTVRIVMKVESQTLLISLPKSKFNTLKELILKTP